METFLFSLIFATSYLGFVLTNQNPDKCGLHQSFPKSGFLMESGEMYVFSETSVGPCLSVLRIVQSKNDGAFFKIKEGYPRNGTDWSNQDFENYFEYNSNVNVSQESLYCPPAVLVFPERIGLVNYLSPEYSGARKNPYFIEWYYIQMIGGRISILHDGNWSKKRLENYFWKDLKSESLERIWNKSQIHSIIRIYNSDSNRGLYNLVYIHDDNGEKHKQSYYLKFDFQDETFGQVEFLQNVSRSLHKDELGQFVAYDIPERNASFGYRFIKSFSIPTIYYTNMTEISIMDGEGRFNKDFIQHMTKREQSFIVPSDIWFGCPPFRDCLHLHIDALTTNLRGQPFIFSREYINTRGTECEFGRKLSSVFPNAPTHIDAAFKDDSLNYFLFKDGKVYQFESTYAGLSKTHTYNVQEVFQNIPNVTAAFYIKSLVYIFTDILNHEESEVWQYEWMNNGRRVQARFLQKVQISFISQEMPSVIDAATVFKNAIILVKDSFYLAIDNVAVFYKSTLQLGPFKPLAGSKKLGCSKGLLPSFEPNFWNDYFAYHRPTAYKKNETVISRTLQTEIYTKPPIFNFLHYLMLISIPFLILAIAFSVYWVFTKRKK